MIEQKPFSESCIQNCEPILKVLKPLFADREQILEVGSGTGQHAVYFAKELPHLVWQTSDIEANHPGIKMWLDEAHLPNTRRPITLDVFENQWPQPIYDGVFSANTTHIMSWAGVVCFINGIGQLLQPGGLFALYGPFNYGGTFTSDSNKHFDHWLKQQDPLSGIRHFEELDKLASSVGLVLQNDIEMPANNRILCWKKD